MRKINKIKNPKKELKNNLATVILISALVSLLIGSLAGYAVNKLVNEKNGRVLKTENGKLKNNENEVSKDLNGLKNEEHSVVSVVAKTSDAVVSIVVSKDVPQLNNFFIDPFFDNNFFNPFGLRQKPSSPEQKKEKKGKREIGGGTGFIVDQDGYIITNRHVVEDPDAEYTVIMNNGKKFKAEIIARDDLVDVAFLKIKTKEKLPTVELGDSNKLKIGQTVIAIGNSLGEFRNTVSRGIISGLKREVTAGDGLGQTELLDEVIQTDAAINPGNSGGPLLDLNGKVIGVNVAIASRAQNIGFAIPVSEITRIYQSVKEHGRIVRPFLGVRYVMLNETIKEDNNLPVENGALILRGAKQTDLAVMPGSPADKAGLEENDIILEIGGVKLDKKNTLAKVISQKNVGDEVTIKLLHQGKEKTVKVKLEESKEEN